MKKVEKKRRWIPLTMSLRLILTRPELLLWTLLLFAVTIVLTWLFDSLALKGVDDLIDQFFPAKPEKTGVFGWIQSAGRVAGDWLYLVVSRIIIFYISFLCAWTLATPGYSILSRAAEKVAAGEAFVRDAAFTARGLFRDLLEGIKMAFFGLGVSVAALLLNLIPVGGQLAAFLLYCGYSALLFIDFPASRRRWHLGRKLRWLRRNKGISLRLGSGPALISLIPVVNIFAMALLFPLLTVHASLNFVNSETPSHARTTSRGEKTGS